MMVHEVKHETSVAEVRG